MPKSAYDRINRLATAELAAAARAAGIRRLVFMSSIRAQSGPTSDHPLTEADPPRPTDAYGRSKLAAEEAVRAANVPFTILRPVLVYGPGVKGNLARLMQLAHSPWPLPFGSFTNRRSLLARQNLIAAIRLALRSAGDHRRNLYRGRSDRRSRSPKSSPRLRAGQGRSPRLVPVPPALIAMALKALHRADVWERLGGEMVADPKKLLRAGWQPPIETRAGLAAMVQATSPRKSGTASRSTR